MRITLRQIYFPLFLIGIFFMPFNSWEGISFLGEFKRESSAIFFLLGFIFILIEIVYTKKVSMPKNSILTFLILFLIWCILTILFNFPVVLDSFYKKTSGVNRFIRQFVSLLISCGVFLYFYYHSLKTLDLKEILQKIRRVLLFSFVVVSIYAFFEIVYIFSGFFPAYQVMRLFDYFPLQSLIFNQVVGFHL